MGFCPECGKELKNDLKFCPFCGKSLVPFQKKTFKPIIGGILLFIASILLLEIIAVQFFDLGTLKLGIDLWDYFPFLFKVGLMVLGLGVQSVLFREKIFVLHY